MPDIIDKATGEVTTWSESDYLAERDRLLMAHQAAETALAVAKASEMTARKAAVDFCFDQYNNSGTERIELGNGYQAKAVKKVNYGWVKALDGVKVDRKKIEAALNQIEALGNEGPFIAERLIKWSPELSLTEYNKLAPQYKAIIDPVIVTTDGAPTLDIIAPKEKKVA